MFENGFSKVKKNYKTAFSAVLIALCLFTGTVLSFCPNSTVYAKARVVKLAVFQLDGYAEYDRETDSWTGMEIDMFNKIAKYANWEVELVPVSNYNAGLKLIDSHEVDFIGSVQLEAENQKKYLYGDIACGFLYNAIATLRDSEKYTYEDYYALDGATIGVNKAYLGRQLLIDVLEEHHVTVRNDTIVEFETDDKMYAALNSGEIDLIAGQMLMLNKSVRPIAFYTPKPYFFMSYNGNDEVVEEMDEAIMAYMVEFPNEAYAGVSEYYKWISPGVDQLTKAEKEYILHNNTIRVGFLTDEFPFSYVEDGQRKGIVVNVLEQLSEDIGIEVEYIDVETIEKGVKMLGDEIDMLSYFTDYYGKQYKQSEVRIIKKYSESRYEVVIEKKTSADELHIIAYTKEIENPNDYFSADVDAIECDTIEECMDMVLNGDADGCLVDSYLYEKLADSDYKYRNLNVYSGTEAKRDVYIAVGSETSEDLVSIFRKVMIDVDGGEVAQYVLANTSMQGYYQGRMLRFISIIVLIILVLVGVFIKLFRDNKRIQTLTSRDTELGIWNTSYFLYHTNLHVKHNPKDDFAIVYLYLSQFRVYSNINGFDKSHKLLQKVLDVLVNRCLKIPEEHYSRSYGGRFLLMLKVDDKDRFAKRLEGIRRLITDEIKTIDTSPMPISFGVCYVDKEELDVSKATSRANMALDAIKSTSSGETVFFDESFESNILIGYEKEKVLDEASLKDDFIVYYQSKVDIRTRQIVGAEALVRFVDRTDGGQIKSPYYFIDYFEQNGRIRKLDFHVLNQVCKMLRRRIDEGKDIVPISVNFSRLHFEDPNFISQLELVVDSYELPRDLIEVEVTETAMVKGFDDGQAIELMDMLLQYGFHLSVDDFGTGYSSLGMLEKIPASVIKLDRSFFRNEKDRDRKIAILKNFVIMARELNVSIVCEGVEFEEDVELMRLINVYVAQGYRFSKPEPEKDFEERLNLQFNN